MPTEVLNGFILELRDAPGELHRITLELARANVNVQGIGAAVLNGVGVIGLVTDNGLETRSILQDLAERVRPVQYLALKTAHHPGALDGVLTRLAKAGLNVVSLFPLIARDATIAMAFDDPVRAREVLHEF